jgi:hypothetical protein
MLPGLGLAKLGLAERPKPDSVPFPQREGTAIAE